MTQRKSTNNPAEADIPRRNPYLVDYAGTAGTVPNQRRQQKPGRSKQDLDLIWGEEPGNRRAVQTGKNRRPIQASENRRPIQASENQRPLQANRNQKSIQASGNQRPIQASENRRSIHTIGNQRPLQTSENRRLAQARRRKAVLRRRMAAAVTGLLTLVLLVVVVDSIVIPFMQDINAEQEEVSGIADGISEKNTLSGITVQGIPAEVYGRHPKWEENFLTVNEYSRPGDPIGEVTNIFVHYTANQGTSAKQNRSYFEQLKDNHERSASSHFIIGYEGEIIQCVPLDEIAYAVIGRNGDSVSIECCYQASDGSFTEETYESLVSLLSWLTTVYGLDTEDILRHYDCGGKLCPVYYVENENAWEQLKNDVKQDKEADKL